MDKKEIVLINKSGMQLHINFSGVFPQNKWAKNEGKVYLTEKEWEWCQLNISKSLEAGWWVLADSEDANKVDEVKKTDEKHAEFFAQHVNKAKAQISKMDNLEEINTLIDYANDNEIDNKAVDALVERANQLGE